MASASIRSVGGGDAPLIYSRPGYGRPPRPFLLVNLDLAATVYYDDRPGVDAGSGQIPPLGTAAMDGTANVYASTLAPGVSVLVQVLPGVTAWSPGLTAGTAPFVLGLRSTSTLDQAASITWSTFPAAARIWGAHVSAAFAAAAGFTGIQHVYARARTAGSVVVTLAIAELAVAAPSTAVDATSDAQVPGLAVQAGDQLRLDLNSDIGGGAPANTVLAGSATVLYSIP